MRSVSASFLPEAFLEFGEFFGGDLRAEKNSFIRISQFEHSGRYFKSGLSYGFNSGCLSRFLSGNLFDRCNVRHVYLLLFCHRTHFSDEFVSCLDAGEGDDPVDEVEERLKLLGRIVFCYSKAQEGDFEEFLRLVVAPLDLERPLGGLASSSSRKAGSRFQSTIGRKSVCMERFHISSLNSGTESPPFREQL